jgi:4-amino-4-deoxy-L-arabinose transferase-like glycosyltransferase
VAPSPGDRALRLVPAAIVAYFALNAALRATTPGGLGLDEAQIMVHAQSLEWGYGLQPPLYAWLQRGAFALLGEGKLALAVVKNALLATAFLAVWAAARAVGASRAVAAVATLALFLVPGIAWEAQRALTHTPLALAAGAVALAVFAHARRQDRTLGYAALGLVLGAGLLSKWNTVFVAAGILGAALARRPRRRRGALLALLVALAVVAPTGAWYLADWGEAEDAVAEIELADRSPLATLPTALAALGEGVVATLGVVAVAFAALLVRRPEPPAPTSVEPRRRGDLTAAVALAVTAVALAVLASGATEVKERWLTPVLFAVPLTVLLWVPERVTARRAAGFAGGAAVIALAVSAGLQWNWRLGDGEPPPQTAPFAAIAAALADGPDVVLAADDWIGGNLLLRAPQLAVLTPATSALRLDVAPPAQLVWRAEHGPAPPETLVALYRERFGRAPRLDAVERVAAPYPPPHDDATLFALMRAVAR